MSLADASAGPLVAIRIVVPLTALVLAIAAARRHHRRAISRLNLIITWLVAAAVVLLGAAPELFNPIFHLFNLRTGTGQRLIGLALAAEVVLFWLVLRNMSSTDSATSAIRELVEALALQTVDWDGLGDVGGDAIVVVMPAHNEAENVGGVLEALPDKVEGLRVLPVVVDDGSTDGTAAVVRAHGGLVARLPIRRGGGLALRVGYEIGLALNAAVVVSMDADGQHVPEELPVLVKPILEDRADMVNGSRVLGEFERQSVVRHLGVHFFSRLVTLMTGSRVTDVSNGYRATKTEVLRRLRLDQDQFWTSELLIEGMRHRLRIVEVPITIRARAGGASKKPKNVKYAWNFSKAIVKTWLR